MSGFNQQDYQNQWNKKNMALVGSQFKKEFVNEFKAACKKLQKKQSEVIRDMMNQTINLANRLDTVKENLISFKTGAEALAFLKNQRDYISLVLVDKDGSLMRDKVTSNLMDIYYLDEFECYGVYASIEFHINYQTDSRTASDEKILQRLDEIIQAGYRFIDRENI